MTDEPTEDVALTSPTEQSSVSRLTGRDNGIAICLTVLLFAVYLFTYRGGFHSIDEVSMFSVTESMVKRGAFDTNQIIWSQWTTSQREAQGFFGQDGDVYSKKGLVMSLFAVPFYWLALQLPGLGMLQTASLLNAVMTALTGGILYLYVRRLACSVAASVLLGLILGLATTAWVYARYLFSEPVAGWLLLMAAFFLLGFKQERHWVFLLGAGLAGGLAVVARANNLLCLPLFALYLLTLLVKRSDEGRRRLTQRWLAYFLIFVGSVALAGSVMGLYNWVRAGSMFQTGYDLTIFSPEVWMGLCKLLFSPLRGLFWFTPILLLTPIAFVGFFRRHRAEAALTGAVLLVNVLLFSAWTSGEGLSWGSRFLVPVLAFAVLPLIDPLQKLVDGHGGVWLVAFVILGGLSVVIQMLGVVVNPWLHFVHLHALFPMEFLEDTPVLYAPRYSPVWGQVQQLLFWDTAKSDVGWLQPWGVQADVAAIIFTLMAVSAIALIYLLKSLRISPRRLVVLPLALVMLAGSISLSTMDHYFERDLQFGPPDDALHRILKRLTEEGRSGDGIVTLMPYHYHVPMNVYKGRLPIYGFSQMAPPLPPEGTRLLQNIAAEHGRIWLVTSGIRPGESPNEVEQWLAGQAFKATDEWYDDFRLCLYASPETSEAPETTEVSNATFGDAIHLDSYAISPTCQQAGEMLTIALDWQTEKGELPDYSVFIHLFASDGTLAAQQDSAAVGGFRPTSTWTTGEVIRDRHGLLLPADLEPGEYALWAGLYDGATGERLPVRLTDGSADDHVLLGTVEVEAP